MSYVPEKTIYLCLAHMSEEGIEQKYVKEAFDTNWVVPLGPNVNVFENDLKNFVGGENEVVALSAGTKLQWMQTFRKIWVQILWTS